MIEKLWPSYSPPTRKQIAEMLLPTILADKSKCAKPITEQDSVTFTGWSNVYNEPSVCVTVTHNGDVHLADTINTSGHSHTSEYLTDIAKIFAKQVVKSL